MVPTWAPSSAWGWLPSEQSTAHWSTLILSPTERSKPFILKLSSNQITHMQYLQWNLSPNTDIYVHSVCSCLFAFVLLFPNCHACILVTSGIPCTVCLFYHGLRCGRSFLPSSSEIFTAKPFWEMPSPWPTACVWSILKHYDPPYVPPSHWVRLFRTGHRCGHIDWPIRFLVCMSDSPKRPQKRLGDQKKLSLSDLLPNRRHGVWRVLKWENSSVLGL